MWANESECPLLELLKEKSILDEGGQKKTLQPALLFWVVHVLLNVLCQKSSRLQVAPNTIEKLQEHRLVSYAKSPRL